MDRASAESILGDVLVGAGDTVAALTDGTVTLDGHRVRSS
jgi:hypothetical protein